MEDLFQAIKKDHKEVKSILKELEKVSDGEAKKREELFMKLKREIKPHMEAEEKVFYPSLKEKEESREDALMAIEEHHVTEMVLNELEKLPKDKENWHAKLSVFKELVEHHIEEEESQVFKDTQKVLSKDQIQGIFEQFKKEKEKVKSQMK